MALPRDALGLSAVCDYGLSLSSSLTIFEIVLYYSHRYQQKICDNEYCATTKIIFFSMLPMLSGCVRMSVSWSFKSSVAQLFETLPYCFYMLAIFTLKTK